MYYLVIGLVLVLSLGVFAFAGGWLKAKPGPAEDRPAGLAAPVRLAAGPSTRAEVQEKLKRLADSPAPPVKLQGAMCYEPRAILDRTEYICPKDGARTLYTNEHGQAEVAAQIQYMREGIKLLKGLDVSLAEHEFCKKCNPGLDPSGLSPKGPALVLVVRYPDARTGKVEEHRVRGVTSSDLQLIQELLSGSLEHGLEGPDTGPLKDHLARLQELLGTRLAAYTRAELQARLQALADTEPPKTLATGAECYKPSMPPTTADYVCPKDGSRTQYKVGGPGSENLVHLVSRALPALRRMVADIPGLQVSLDESELCRKCNPGAKDPAAVLVIMLPGEKAARRVRGVTEDDLRLLRELATGALAHKDAQDGETPLKDHLPRIRELLGIESTAK